MFCLNPASARQVNRKDAVEPPSPQGRDSARQGVESRDVRAPASRAWRVKAWRRRLARIRLRQGYDGTGARPTEMANCVTTPIPGNNRTQLTGLHAECHDPAGVECYEVTRILRESDVGQAAKATASAVCSSGKRWEMSGRTSSWREKTSRATSSCNVKSAE